MYEEWIEAVWAELRILVWSATTGESRQVSSADLATWIAAQSNPQQLLKMAYAAERHVRKAVNVNSGERECRLT